MDASFLNSVRPSRCLENSQELSVRLRRWAIEEMKWKEQTVLSEDALKRISMGHLADIWEFVINHVLSLDAANKVRINVQLQRKLEGNPSTADFALNKLESRHLSELECSRMALQLEEDEVRHLSDAVMEKEREIRVVVDRIEALDMNNSLLETLVSSDHWTSEAAGNKLSSLQQQKEIFLYSSIGDNQRTNDVQKSLSENVQKLGQMSSVVFADNLDRSYEFRDKEICGNLMDKIFSTYRIEDIISAVIDVGEMMCGQMAELDDNTDAATWSDMAKREKVLLRLARQHRNGIFYQILEQETMAAKAEAQMQHRLKRLREKSALPRDSSDRNKEWEFLDAKIHVAATKAAKQYLEETMFASAHYKNKCSEAIQLIQEKQEAISSLNYMQKYHIVKDLIMDSSEVLYRLKELRSEATTACDSVNFDVPFRTKNGLKSWQRTDAVFKAWNSMMLDNWINRGSRFPIEMDSTLAAVKFKNPSNQATKMVEANQELECLVKLLNYCESVMGMDQIGASSKRVKSILRKVVGGDLKKREIQLPKLNAGLKMSDDSFVAIKKLERTLTEWWENPVHNFELVNKVFGLTFHQWKMRWMKVAR